MPAQLNGSARRGAVYPRYTLLTHVRLIDTDARSGEICDILIARDSAKASGRIVAVGPNLKTDGYAPLTRVRGSGYYACRSFVDLHMHTCEPGAMYKEEIRTATAAAALGGYGDVLAIPSLPSAWQEGETLEYIYSNASVSGKIPLLAAAYLTKGNRGEVLSDLEGLRARGAAAFYEEGNASPALLYIAMERLSKLGALLILRCDTPLLSKRSEQTASSAAEAMALSSALTAAALTGCRLHLTLVSTALSIELIREARARGVRVTCDTAPQYFTLTSADRLYYGNLAKVSPPLRSRRDRDAILDAIADGTIDCIVSDHTPETAEDKRKPPADAPSGMIGLQTVFALGMRELVLTGRIDLYRLIDLLATNPARILGLSERITPDTPSKVTLLDLTREYTLSKEMLESKSQNCPWMGQSFQGSVMRNFSRINER